ncbi:MAG: hypothetical protein E7618_06210 [Ruminococcaceae bacterium]|nr:hypothetical protein [Oscillospiraceae bacterium]
MKSRLSIVLLISLLLLGLSACLVPPDSSADNPESTESVTEPNDDSQSMTQDVDLETTEPIHADLNGDGAEDDIVITYGDEVKHTATIRVIAGNDGGELFADTLVFDANKTGVYYLQLGKGKEPDKLVYWYYGYLNDGQLSFAYYVFRFDTNGEVQYDDRGGRTFNVSFDAALDSGNEVFQVMIHDINQNIQESREHYTAYLLMDNRGQEIVISTADNMLPSQELNYHLRDFVIRADA